MHRYILSLGDEQLDKLIDAHRGTEFGSARILICTGDAAVARCQTERLRRSGLWSDVAMTAERAILRLASGLYAVVTIDAAMMDASGISIVHAMARSKVLRRIPVIVIATAHNVEQDCAIIAICLTDWVAEHGTVTRILDI